MRATGPPGMAMNTSFFGEMLQSITERGRALLDLARDRRDAPAARSESLVELCEELLTGRGEASGVALASEILAKYAELTTGPRIAFFEALAHRFGPDKAKLDAAIADWQAKPSDATAAAVHHGRRAAPAGAVPPAQSRARRHRRAGAHARAVDRRARPPRRPRRGRSPISSICSRRGSTAASWCCGGSTGRRRR